MERKSSLFNTTRKVIALGKASFAIILPKEWVVHQHINKGSEVVLFPQQNGQIIIQKSRTTKTRMVLDSGSLGEDLFDAAIQSTFFLNVDETVAKYSKEDALIDKINHLWEVSKNFNGMDLAVSGPHEVTMTCLVDTLHLNIIEIFDQMLSSCGLLLAQIGQNEFDRDNRNAIAQMEEKYHLGVRLLIFALRNQNIGLQVGMRDIIQVLGYRVALLAMRSIILQLNDIIPYLKSAGIPDLSLFMDLCTKLTQQAVQCLRETDVSSIQQLTGLWSELKVQVSKIGDAAGTARNFFNNYLEMIHAFEEVATTRYVESLEVPCEE